MANRPTDKFGSRGIGLVGTGQCSMLRALPGQAPRVV